MKLAFVISPSRVWISSINASPSPCAVPPSIWPWTACGLSALPTSWAAPIQTTRVRPSSTSTSATTRMAAQRRRHGRGRRSPGRSWDRAGTCASGGTCARGRPRRRRALGSSSASWHASRTAPAAIQVRREAEADPAESTPGRAGGEDDVLRAELGARHLQDHFVTPCPTSAAAQCTSAASSSSGRADARAPSTVVEALRVADVLEADGKADAALHALSARRVPRSAGQADRVARELLCLRHRQRRARRITSATGSEPVTTWPMGIVSPGPRAFRSRSSIGSISRVAASLSICASCAKQPWTAPKPRMAPQGGLFE